MARRRIIRNAVVGVVATLVLAGCGSSGGGSGSDDPIVIGFATPLTSGNAAVAEQKVNTAKLAVKTINEAGGAGGRKLELKVYDSKLTADESAKITQRAITVDGADVMMGGYTSIEGLAIRQITEARKMIFMNSSTISPALLDGARYTFRAAHDQGDYPIQMVELLKKLGYKRPVVTADDGPTGATLHKPIVEEAKKAGLEPGKTVSYKLGSTDLTSAVAELKAQRPDSIVHIGSSAADAGLMLKTMNEAGVKVPAVGFGSLIAPDALRIGGSAYKQLPGVYTLANQQPSKARYKEFIKAYAAEYGGDPDALALELNEAAVQTWDAFEILRQALEKTDGETNGDKLLKVIEGLEPFEGSGGKEGSSISFKETHNAYTQALVPFKFVDGKPEELTD